MEEKKQAKLTDSRLRKRVTFTEEEAAKAAWEKEKEDLKASIADEVKKIRQEKAEIGKLKIDLECKIAELSETVAGLNLRLEKVEEREREREEARSIRTVASGTSGEACACAGEGVTGSQWSLFSGQSKGSRFSVSEREIKIMKRVVSERDRRDRENNIVIRGWRFQGEDLKEEVKKFLAEKVDFHGEVETAWVSGGVTIAKLGRVEKIEVMKRKCKLVGTRIFIENDLSYDDRKKQEEINRWVKEKKRKGYENKGRSRENYVRREVV